MSSLTRAGRLAPIVLLTMLLTTLLFTTPVLAEDYVYWADSEAKKIQRASVDDGVVEDVVVLPAGTTPLGIALDLAEGKVYWTECCDGNVVKRADLDGSSIEQLLPNDDGDPQNGVASRTIDLDLTNRKLYVIDAYINAVGYRSNLGGTNVEEILSPACDRAGVAVDPAGGKIYISCRTWDTIERANLDGTDLTVLVNGTADPRQVALDLGSGKVYWADAFGTIQRANLDGTGVEDLVTGLGFIHGLALDLQKGKVYWSSPGSDSIQRCDLDGSNIEDIVTGIPSPVEIALELDVSVEQMVEDLVSDVLELNIGAGISNSLDSKLKAALAALDDLNKKNKKNKAKAAIGSLGAFINAVEAQRGKQLTDEQADELIAAAQQIIDMLLGG